jgi:hypothetical protein
MASLLYETESRETSSLGLESVFRLLIVDLSTLYLEAFDPFDTLTPSACT